MIRSPNRWLACIVIIVTIIISPIHVTALSFIGSLIPRTILTVPGRIIIVIIVVVFVVVIVEGMFEDRRLILGTVTHFLGIVCQR